MFEDTHEPLVSKDVWDIVQSVRRNKRRLTKMGEQNIYSGLVVCADCGKPLVLHRSHNMKEARYRFNCLTYKMKGKEVCSAHYIRLSQLEAIILEDLRRTLWFAASNEREFAAIISKKSNTETKREIKKHKAELDALRRRESELGSIFKRLYEDSALDRISYEQFHQLSNSYTDEQKSIADMIPKAEDEIKRLEALVADVGRFIEQAKKYTHITELTSEILRTFISKVVVHERSERYSRSATQKVEIHYAHIGALEFVQGATDQNTVQAS